MAHRNRSTQPSRAQSEVRIPSELEDNSRERWKKNIQRAKYYIPSIKWISQYSISNLSGDVVAGMTVSSVLIPQSISYAASLGQLSPAAGLLCGSFPAVVYAFLGTSRQLNVGPTAAVSLLVGKALTDVRQRLLSADPDLDWENERHKIGIAVATMITLQAGVISFLLGLFRLGFIDVVLSRAVLRGFVSALGAVIIIEQLPPLLGLAALERAAHPHNNFEKIAFLWKHALMSYHRETVIVGVTALFSLLLLRKLKTLIAKKWGAVRQFPEVLFVVILSTYLSAKLQWHDRLKIDVLGPVEIRTSPSEFFQSPFQPSNFRFFRQTLSTSILICVVGFLDSIASAKQNAVKFGHSISPNRELVALGVANLAISFVPGTITAFGSTSRSRINGDAGGRTQFSSVVTSIIVLFVTFFMMHLLYHLPKCVLSAIMCLVAYSLLEETPKDLRYYLKMHSSMDITLLSLTFFLSIIWEIQEGIIVSVIISLLLVVKRSSKARISLVGRARGSDEWEALDPGRTDIEEAAASGVLIVRIRENLNFANSSQLQERLRRIELFGVEHTKRHPSDDRIRDHTHVIVFDMCDVEDCDAAAIQIFSEIIQEYQNRFVRVYLVSLGWYAYQKFVQAGVFHILDEDLVLESVEEAMRLVERGSEAE